MISLQGLGKPQYLFRPSQIFRRLLREFRQGDARQIVTLPWKLKIEIDTSDTVGEAIASQGIYDLVTSEVLWRLTSPGDAALDIGANIGYMTSLLARRAGPQGLVSAFEPHPKTFLLLQRNAGRWNRGSGCARITLHNLALSDRDGEAALELIPGQENNASWAYLNFQASPASMPVKIARLETLLDGGSGIGVMKVDTEAHEAAIFHGAGALLRSGKIRDIVFEEEAPFPAASHNVLEQAGYALFWFREQLRGPVLIPPDARPPRKRDYDILPSYLATLDPQRARRLLAPRGWRSLG